MLTSILLFGFVMGMRHAIEADHLAAISVLVSRKRRGRDMVRHGAIWGIGHTLALGFISSIVFFSPWVLPKTFGPTLEFLIGLLLVALGVHLLYRLWRDRVHIHIHHHEPGRPHLHAHSHRDEPASHAESPHEHDHASWSWRTLAVGLAHGAAGSAALTVYVAASLESPVAGILYVLLFGLGSILGMAALTAAIAVPLRATATRLTWANRGLHSVISLASIALGVRLAIAQGGVLWS
ncbi:MAG TPA: sulfite exporter TauE/SafE family protein [Thiobacillus sp.]